MLDYLEYYNEIAPIFNSVRLDREPEFSSTLSVISNNSRIGNVVLDVGCGTGAYATALQEIGYNVVGIDKSPEQIKIAQQTISALIGDAIDLPFNNASFDLCLMIMMLHQIDPSERDSAFSETTRVLRRGGKLIIKTQSHDDLKHRKTSVFFPKAFEYNLIRYPEISNLCNRLRKFGHVRELSTRTVITQTVEEILSNLKNKGTSSVAMLTSQEFRDGFQKAEAFYSQFESLVDKNVFHTYIILQKETD